MSCYSNLEFQVVYQRDVPPNTEILKSQIVISNSSDNQIDNVLKSQIVISKKGRGQYAGLSTVIRSFR